MSAKTLQPQQSQSPHLRIVNGPLEGTSYPIIGSKITLGRSSDNDIVLKHDTKCSRQHAVLNATPKGFVIESLNNKNPVSVNGQPVDKALLLPNVTLLLGETKIVFVAPALQPAAPLAAVQNSEGLAIREAPGPFAGVEVKPKKKTKGSNSSRRQKDQQSPVFMIIIGVVVLGGIYLATSESAKKVSPTKITSSKDIEAEIKAAQKIQRDKDQAAIKQNRKTAQYKEAQSAYLKGFRDYKRGLYSRAKDSFQTCLSLYPDHTLCKRYLGLSNRKFDEVVQYNLRLGKDHRERNQYRACKNAMRTVLVMVKDKADKRYQQAKAQYDACHAQLGDGI